MWLGAKKTAIKSLNPKTEIKCLHLKIEECVKQIISKKEVSKKVEATSLIKKVERKVSKKVAREVIKKVIKKVVMKKSQVA